MKIAGENKQEIDRRVRAAAESLQLTKYLDRLPKALSGGQRQRVALAPDIFSEHNSLPFDEPFTIQVGALRVQMRLEITQLHQDLATTMIYVTHDQVEAMTMADKIVVLNAGNIEQVGAPLELYNHPANLFVAGFIGSPKMNLLQGEAAKRHNAATIGVRPEHIAASRDRGEWQGVVRVAEHLGSDTFLHIDSDAIGRVTARAAGELSLAAGDQVGLTPRPDRIHRFDSDGRAMRA
jgi:multiple sugar transport system ATP-binding protein